MTAVALSGTDCEREIVNLGLQDEIKLACVNSPKNSTISGNASAIDHLTSALKNKGIFARKLRTDSTAYHSHHMRTIGQEYEELISLIYSMRPTYKLTAPRARMLSSVTGGLAARKLVDTAKYWRRNLESTVLFSDAMQNVLTEKPYHLIEIGPHSALQQPIKEIQTAIETKEGASIYTPALSRGKDAEQSLLELCGTLFLYKQPVSLNKANRLSSMHENAEASVTRCKFLKNLPTYVWNRQALLWNESRVSIEFRARQDIHHSLLGSRVLGTAKTSSQWRNVLNVKELPWLEDHNLGTTRVFPGAGYLALAAEALC